MPHDDNAADGFAFAVPFGNALADVRAEAHCSKVAQQHGRPIVAAECNFGQIVQGMQITEAADHVACSVQVQLAPADFIGAGFYAVNHGGKRNAVGEQLVRIQLYLILLHVTADAGDLRHTGHSFELIAQMPVFETSQIGQAVPVAPIDDCIFVNPARAGRIRADDGMHLRG